MGFFKKLDKIADRIVEESVSKDIPKRGDQVGTKRQEKKAAG